MSTVPYTFATNTGNIPLSELDANFANVKASVDYATLSGLAGYVTSNAQANITSLGTLSSLSVSGNVTTARLSSTGNVVAGNVTTAGLISATGNITGGNISSTGNVIAGNVIADNFIGNISAGANLEISGYVSATSGLYTNGNYVGANIQGIIIDYTGNIGRISVGSDDGINFYSGNVGNVLLTSIDSGGNLSASGEVFGAGLKSSSYLTCGNLIYSGVEVVSPNYISVTSTNTYSLSSSTSTNILIANNTGYTATINFPGSPRDGQITAFTVSGNTVTLAAGTGTATPSYAGSTAAGVGFKYVYRTSTATWYQLI